MAIEIHVEKRIVNQNVIREADSKSHRDYIVVSVLAAVFLLGVFAYAWQHYRWIQYGYRIREAQMKKEHLSEVYQQLIVERASLSSLQRIDSIARRDLGMVAPAPGQLVTLHSDLPLKAPMPREAVEAQPAALSAKR